MAGTENFSMDGKNRRDCHSCRGCGKNKDFIEDLSRLSKNLAQISKEEDVEILLNSTIRKITRVTEEQEKQEGRDPN